MGGRKASRFGGKGEEWKGALPIPDSCAPLVDEGSRVGRVPWEAGREMEGQGEGRFVPGAGQFYLRQRSK